MKTKMLLGVAFLLTLPVGWVLAAANSAQTAILDGYAATAKTENAAFAGFSADRGKAFFLATSTTGKPDTPSCSTCHTTSPQKPGLTRAGKEIAPMAVSATPDRFTDPAKVEKWFGRNCESVLGRACTATEKGDFITFMLSQ